MTFEEFNLHPQLLEAIGYMGFNQATPIQEKSIPAIKEGRDLIACAQTGTGKTAAFILPILHKLASKNTKGTNTLVICPTRELAIQIDQQIQGFSYFIDVKSIAIYGGGSGSDFAQEKSALSEGANIIVATPGKLISHLNLGYVNFKNIEHLILDEADRMLDMGFLTDIEKIISFLPPKRQNLFFSATMPPKIRSFAKRYLKNPLEITLAVSKPAEGVQQLVYFVPENQKISVLSNYLKTKDHFENIIVFSSTKKKIFDIVQGLRKNGFSSYGISSDLEQQEREDILMKFRAKRIRILVATDVLSRGIDIKDIHLVVNFDVPNDPEEYVHRVGRTARANTNGVAITMVDPKEKQKFSNIEKLIGNQLEVAEI